MIGEYTDSEGVTHVSIDEKFDIEVEYYDLEDESMKNLRIGGVRVMRLVPTQQEMDTIAEQWKLKFVVAFNDCYRQRMTAKTVRDLLNFSVSEFDKDARGRVWKLLKTLGFRRMTIRDKKRGTRQRVGARVMHVSSLRVKRFFVSFLRPMPVSRGLSSGCCNH